MNLQNTMKKSGHSRTFNRRLVFDALRRKTALSKAELSRETNLTPQTVANIVDGLVASGYVLEMGRRASPRGQPPVVLEINPRGGFSVGIRIDKRRFDIVISDLLGTVLFSVDGVTPHLDTDGLIEYISDAANAAIKKSKLPKRLFLGVGLVTPGPFDIDQPQTGSPGALPGFQTQKITVALSENIRLPVLLENDAAAAAIGEQLFGSGKLAGNFFYIFIAEGVGGGLIWNTELYRGAHGNAGEFGHHIVDPNGPTCYCGNKGCLGQYLSLSSLRSYLSDHGVKLNKYAEIDQLISAGNPHLSTWVDTAVQALRPAIASVENLLDPEAIILGGTAPISLLEELQNRLGPPLPSIVSSSRGIRIVVGKNPRQNIAQGAAAIPIIAATSPNPAVLLGQEKLSLG